MNIEPDTLFRSLADATRLRALLLLQAEGELCVCELTHALGLAQPKISHHLASLRKAGLVEGRKQGLWVYYRLHPELSMWVAAVLERTAAGNAANAPFVDDLATLRAMPNRPGAACCA